MNLVENAPPGSRVSACAVHQTWISEMYDEHSLLSVHDAQLSRGAAQSVQVKMNLTFFVERS